MESRVGVFLCSCAGSLREAWDWPAYRDALADDPALLALEEHELLCAPDGRAFLTGRARELELTHVVVAACSAREHESTFRQCLSQAGINPYLLHLANIREHCAWVTPDPVSALSKASAITRAAIARVVKQTPLLEEEVEVCPDVVVIGGGIAGMEAALLCEQAGRRAILVESSPSIGGRVVHLEAVAPGLECAPCLLAPRMSAVGDATAIELITNARVRDVVGWAGKFLVRVHRKARRVDPSLCLGAGCDACADACPAKAASPDGRSERKAIFVPFAGAIPNCAVIDFDLCVRSSGQACTACAEACPMEAVRLDDHDEDVEVPAGCVLVATGAEPDDDSAAVTRATAASPDVICWSEFEAMVSTNGPTGGKLVRRDGRTPETVAVVHCVGRKDLGYCSGVCCQVALKAAVVLAERDAGVPVTHVLSDLVLRDPRATQLYERALAAGARFVRVEDPGAADIAPGPDGCRVTCASPSGPVVIDASMVVVVSGLRPSAGTKELMGLVSAPASAAGFALPAHAVLRRQATMVEGVYAIGAAGGPRTAAESVESARAAAGDALSRVQPGRRVKLEATTAEIEAERCGGCKLCISACPFKACGMDEEGARVTVNRVLCRGCGSCEAACPSGAATARHFTRAQIVAELHEVLRG